MKNKLVVVKKATKARNPKRKIKTGPRMKSLPPRTPSSIITALANSSINNNMMKMPGYVHCRVNPFTGAGNSIGIPDGANSNYIVSDFYIADTITDISGDFMIQTFPILPYLAGITATNNNSLAVVSVNGFSVPGVSGGNAASTRYVDGAKIQGGFFPISIPPGFYNPTGSGGNYYRPGVDQSDPYNSMTARLVSVGYRLTYTGPANTCSGVITVTPTPIAISQLGQTTSSAGDPGADLAIGIANASSATVGLGQILPKGVTVFNMDSYSIMGTVSKETITLRPESGAIIVPKHKTQDYKMLPTMNNVAAVVADYGVSPSTTNLWSNLFERIDVKPGTGARVDGGIIWFDNDWESVSISFSGINSDASFRFETVGCFEFSLPPNSSFVSLAKKTSPSMPQQIKQAEAIVNSAPVAKPANGSGRPK